MIRSSLTIGLLLVTGATALADAPETLCELMAELAPDWLASHETGKTVEEISAETMSSFDQAGLTADDDRGAIFRAAASVSLIGLAQNNPQSPKAASAAALEACAIWYRTRKSQKTYQIPDRPMLWN